MSSSAKIAVIDNGLCNLRSVTKAFEAVGATPHVIRTHADLGCDIDGLVLPGVGALGDCVAALRASKLDDTVRRWIADDRPFLGVCLGMQALFELSEENDGVTGLGIFAGKVVRFRRPPEFKIPHMGWNTIRFTQTQSPMTATLKTDGEAFYFVHSFHCVPADQSLVLAECNYGGAFTAAIGRGNCFATQFHPEKSQAKGLQLYKNFADIASGVLHVA
jgi:imidazole glycerol-phosphate synthase subunit HisH